MKELLTELKLTTDEFVALSEGLELPQDNFQNPTEKFHTAFAERLNEQGYFNVPVVKIQRRYPAPSEPANDDIHIFEVVLQISEES